MTNYWDERFMQHIDKSSIHTIVEVGARYGDESKILSNMFNKAQIYSFECNPLTIDICRSNLQNNNRIRFFDYGLGDVNTTLPFYSYTQQNDGASSFFKRIDFERTQRETGYMKIRTLFDFTRENHIATIDLLCMDIQGYELNVLKGCDTFISNVKYVIMEEPKSVINHSYLPKDTYSKYIGAPSYYEIKQFMEKHNFVELERIDENAIEDNVLYIHTEKMI
jgi:FkbM family methyltransferase